MTSMMTSSDAGSYMASDMDEEGLIAFNSMAREAMKIERLVIQQKELGKKLGELLAKTKRSEEKARGRQKHLQSDIHSYASKNKLMKENLNGKKSTRKMVEQMTSDLERQLHLERNDIANKVLGFSQTQRKYTDMWQQYEKVYLSSNEAKELKQVQVALEEAKVCLGEHEAEKEGLKTKVLQLSQERDAELVMLVVRFAGLARTFRALQERQRAGTVLLASLTEACTRERQQVDHLSQQLVAQGVCKPSQPVAAPESMDFESATGREMETPEQEKPDSVFRSRYKNMLSLDLMTLPELELPELDLGSLEVPEEVDDDFSQRYNQLGEDVPESCLVVSAEIRASPIFSLPVAVAQAALVDPEPSVESPEPVTPQDTEMEEEQEGPAQDDEEMVQEVVQQEPPEEPQSHPPPETEGQWGETNGQPGIEENMQEEELQQQDAMSEGWESCAGEQVPSPYFHSAASQSSLASSLELLDDEKRKAYMLQLMASPEFSVEQRAIVDAQMDVGGQQPSQARSGFLSQVYQMFSRPAAASTCVSQISEEAPFSQATSDNGNQDIAQEESLPEAAALPTEQSASSFTPMSSLFGPPAGQMQDLQPASEPAAFNFGSFSFGSTAPQSSGPANFFGGGSNPFGEPPPAPRGSEAFNLNFDNKSNTSSIFKLF